MSANRRNFLMGILASLSGVWGGSILAAGPAGQGRGGRGHGGRGPNADPAMRADHELIQTLLQNRQKIQRKIKNLPGGVETWTETEDPQVRAVLVKHVRSMYERVEKQKPIHRRDPLFNAIFQNAKRIKMEFEATEKGIHVIETSDDPYTVKLIQSHAQVVSLFLKNGHKEVRKNHVLPQ